MKMDRAAVIHGDGWLVAFVDVEEHLTTESKLEKAFMMTNSVDDAWWNNPGVTPMFNGDTCRSTSVGDHVLIGNKKFVCEKTGWSPL